METRQLSLLRTQLPMQPLSQKSQKGHSVLEVLANTYYSKTQEADALDFKKRKGKGRRKTEERKRNPNFFW